MTKLKLASKVRAYTKQSSTSLTDATLLPIANDAKNEIAELIASRDIKGNYFIVPFLYTLTANQREYPLDAGVLDHIYTVEFAFSQASPIPYILASKDDFRRLGLGRTEANIQANYSNIGGSSASNAFATPRGMFANVGPCYELQRRAIYLLSGAIDSTTLGGSTVASGIRIRSRIFPADLATNMTDDTTDLSVDPTLDANNVGTTFGLPKQFHELWARRMSIDWKSQNPGAVPLSPLELRYDKDLEAALSGIENNDMSDSIIGGIPYDNGYNY